MFKKLSAALVAMSLVAVAQHASAQNNSVSAAQAAAPASQQLSPAGKKLKALADEIARAEAAKKKSVADMQALVDATKAAKAAAEKNNKAISARGVHRASLALPFYPVTYLRRRGGFLATRGIFASR